MWKCAISIVSFRTVCIACSHGCIVCEMLSTLRMQPSPCERSKTVVQPEKTCTFPGNGQAHDCVVLVEFIKPSADFMHGIEYGFAPRRDRLVKTALHSGGTLTTRCLP